MPAWWGKKSTKRNAKDPKSLSPNSPSSLKNEITERRERPKSFGELSGMEETRNSSRASRDFPSARGSSGFSGFDSPSSMDRGHPLPEPSVSPSSVGNDHGVRFASGSDSGSSVSSSGSCDDHSCIARSQFSSFRGGIGDSRHSPVTQSPVRSRVPTTSSSPLHPRSGGVNLDTPAGRLDEGKSEGHRLPLPPGSPNHLLPASPTRPSTLPIPRTCGIAEASTVNLSKWKKGRLLGRGTFGTVYLGFNSFVSRVPLPIVWLVMNTNGYSLAVDIWSLGCTVLEMATSKPPWSQYEGVAAIFKIGNSKDMPDIPDHLSTEAKSFVRLCLQRDPSARPTASQLLEHPFVKDQIPTKVAHNVNIINQVHPRSFDGNCTPPALEFPPNGRNTASLDGRDYSVKPVVTNSRAMTSSGRENAKAVTSLPVSPCSSPLRRYAHRISYLSPPHRSYLQIGGEIGNNHNVYPTFEPRANRRNNLLDTSLEIPPYRRTQTPGQLQYQMAGWGYMLEMIQSNIWGSFGCHPNNSSPTGHIS
ncbi:unnamed protein product [Cuscuta campestris]|uniref:Protein kinase domain-containing protein n=1 Tax=Cuscuta campestris TaxID=132261 RepID=A0A484MX42_9ASTE|nr:unnamed protein product [Cuscuta campestris]